MNVEIKDRIKWKLLRDHSDASIISERSGISRVTISNVLNGANGNKDTIDSINDFYDKKLSETKNEFTQWLKALEKIKLK